MDNWYHGSPVKLNELRTGSTITKHYNLAFIFSHKPSTVSINDEGKIKHDGRENGLLYVVDEPIDHLQDIEPHPRSTMDKEMEWLTNRTFKLKLLEEIGQPKIEDLLTEEEIDELMNCRN
ncbi:hypothetical protein [Paenibacillus apii]|uniref:hypothetical protein n=1 Tax=Paenibacillus apii TaxID=1850370 RepID=UPI001439EAE4|nr:hypothetical protein [Paenibacillus apii]NJJ40710.1 hypothetical protein [Paenibacillus apii]